jgi:preprotein translocase subunit SecB
MADNLEPVFLIQRMYLKDMSLEQPNSPGILLSQDQPTVDIQIALGSEQVGEGLYEITVTATVTASIQTQTMFLVEAKQAGIFEIRHLTDPQMEHVVNVVSPQIIYPYLRSNVADVIQRGGFPPVHMAEINFQAMFEQQQRMKAEQQLQ